MSSEYRKVHVVGVANGGDGRAGRRETMNVLKTKLIVLCALFILIAQAVYLFEGNAQEQDREKISIHQIAEFNPVLPVLQRMVDDADIYKNWLDRQSIRGLNHLYVCPVNRHKNDADNYVYTAWVYWQEGRAIILWEPGRSGDIETRDMDLVYSRRFLSLTRDVVPTQDDIGSSTYLVDQEWVDTRINECSQRGDAYLITKREKQD